MEIETEKFTLNPPQSNDFLMVNLNDQGEELILIPGISKNEKEDLYFKINSKKNLEIFDSPISQRCGHAYAKDEKQRKMWIFGGKDRSNNLLDQFWQISYNQNDQLQFQLISCNPNLPGKRTSSSMFRYKDHLYLYGGITESGNTSSDLFK